MSYYTGIDYSKNASLMNIISNKLGNIRSIIWFLEVNKNIYIISLRHNLLNGSCAVCINNSRACNGTVTRKGQTFDILVESKNTTISIATRDDSLQDVYSYKCESNEAKVVKFLHPAYLASLKEFLTLTVFYDTKTTQYEFHVAEYRWSLHILVKKLQDIKTLYYAILSIYTYLDRSYHIPQLPLLPQREGLHDEDGFIIVDSLQKYFDEVISLPGSAFIPELLEFLELPVSGTCFEYSKKVKDYQYANEEELYT